MSEPTFATVTPSLRQMRIATAVYFFISGFGYSAWASRIPSIKDHLHLNEAQLGSILFLLPVGLMFTLPITNQLLGRFSSKAIMLFGSVFFNIMLCMAGFVSAPWQLVLILFSFGASRNLLNLSMNAIAVKLQAMYIRSIMTSFHGIWSLAGFAGAALGYFMVSFHVSIRWHLPLVGLAMTLLSLLFYSTALYQPPAPARDKKIFALPDRYLLQFALIAFACMACENTMYDWSGIYFQQAVHSSRPTAVAGFVLYMVAMTAGRFWGDRLVNQVGIEKILLYSGGLITVGLLTAVLLPYPVTASIGFMFTGLGVSCIVPLVFNLAGQSKSMNSHTALAAISTVGYLGFLLVPPIVGFIAQVAGIRVSFGLIALLGILIVRMVRNIRVQPSPASGPSQPSLH